MAKKLKSECKGKELEVKRQKYVKMKSDRRGRRVARWSLCELCKEMGLCVKELCALRGYGFRLRVKMHS